MTQEITDENDVSGDVEIPEMETEMITEQFTPQQIAGAKAELDTMTKVESSGDDTVHSLIKSLDTETDIESKTELNSAQIIAVSRALWKAKHYGLKSLELFTLYLLKTTISKDRKGRAEKIQALTGALQWQIQKQKGERVEV